jgi:hypothetical protein
MSYYQPLSLGFIGRKIHRDQELKMPGSIEDEWKRKVIGRE